MGNRGCEEALWLISLMTRIPISSLLKPLFLRNSRGNWLMNSKTWSMVSGICSQPMALACFCSMYQFFCIWLPSHSFHLWQQGPTLPAILTGQQILWLCSVFSGEFYEIKLILCIGLQKLIMSILSHSVFKWDPNIPSKMRALLFQSIFTLSKGRCDTNTWEHSSQL